MIDAPKKIDEESGAKCNHIGGIVPEIEPMSWEFWRKRRYLIVLMVFFGLFNMYSLRAILSVGIVAMTENRTVHYHNGTIGYEQEFSWDSKDRGIVLSSFFWGYIMTQFLGGWLASKVGGNVVFGIGIALTSILTLITPLAAKAGVGALITVRLIEGIFEGVTFPCIKSIWSRWAPPLERTRMATLSLAGCYVGTIISMPASSILAEQYGWESLFYIFGAIGCVWYLFWIIIVRESPDKDKYISKDELRYIQCSLGTNKNTDLFDIKHPWKDIFTSKPVYAICAAQFAIDWGVNTMLTQLPSFLKDTLGFKLEQAGFLASAPYLATTILLVISGYWADVFQISGYLTTTQVRRYFICGGILTQTVFLMAAAFVSNPTGKIACIIIAIGLGGLALCSSDVNHLDIAPQHASVIMGFSNTFNSFTGIISPTLVGYIVVNSTQDEWRIVFMISSAVYLFGFVIYLMWGTGEIQSWAQISGARESNNKPTPSDATTYVGNGIEGLEKNE